MVSPLVTLSCDAGSKAFETWPPLPATNTGLSVGASVWLVRYHTRSPYVVIGVQSTVCFSCAPTVTLASVTQNGQNPTLADRPVDSLTEGLTAVLDAEP